MNADFLPLITVAFILWLCSLVGFVFWLCSLFKSYPLDHQTRMEFWLKYHLKFKQVITDPRYIVEENEE